MMYNAQGKAIRRDEIPEEPVEEDEELTELEKRDLFQDLEQNYDFEYDEYPEI